VDVATGRLDREAVRQDAAARAFGDGADEVGLVAGAARGSADGDGLEITDRRVAADAETGELERAEGVQREVARRGRAIERENVVRPPRVVLPTDVVVSEFAKIELKGSCVIVGGSRRRCRGR